MRDRPPEIRRKLIEKVSQAFPGVIPFLERDRELRKGPEETRRVGGPGGIFDYALAHLTNHGPEDPEFQKLLQLLENEYTSAPPSPGFWTVKDTIINEFLEGIRDSGNIRDRFLEALPPNMRSKAEAMKRSEALCLELAAADPWLEEFVNEEINYNEEILPHVIVGDLFSELLRRMEQFGADDHIVAKVLEVLERTMQNDPEEEPWHGPKSVIAVSFIEHMPYQGEFGAKLAKMLPPAMKAELEAQERWAAERSHE